MKVKFLKSIYFKDEGFSRVGRKDSELELNSEEVIVDLLYTGLCILSPSNFPEEGKYRIHSLGNIRVNGRVLEANTIMTLDAETAAIACSHRWAEPLDPKIWVPGRVMKLQEPRKLYTEG